MGSVAPYGMEPLLLCGAGFGRDRGALARAARALPRFAFERRIIDEALSALSAEGVRGQSRGRGQKPAGLRKQSVIPPCRLARRLPFRTPHMLTMTHLSKVYRTEMVETYALRDFSIHVPEGEFVAVTGPS